MTALAIAQSSFITSLLRYSRSWGLWLLLLVAPGGARFMISNDDGQGIQIAVGQHLPVMTSAVLGVSLGVVVSTLLLPIGYIFLRSNTTRNQPWQVEEVTAAAPTEGLPRMNHSVARVETERASIYLQQLCKHFAHKLPVSFTP